MKNSDPEIGDIIYLNGAHYYVTKKARNKKEYNAFEITSLDGTIVFNIKRYELDRFLSLIGQPIKVLR